MSEKKIPLRKCIGCNEMIEKQNLVRVVKTKEGEILLDLVGKANGRGAYLCKNAQCFRKARKNKGLERSLKVRIPEETWEQLEQECGV